MHAQPRVPGKPEEVTGTNNRARSRVSCTAILPWVLAGLLALALGACALHSGPAAGPPSGSGNSPDTPVVAPRERDQKQQPPGTWNPRQGGWPGH